MCGNEYLFVCYVEVFFMVVCLFVCFSCLAPKKKKKKFKQNKQTNKNQVTKYTTKIHKVRIEQDNIYKIYTITSAMQHLRCPKLLTAFSVAAPELDDILFLLKCFFFFFWRSLCFFFFKIMFFSNSMLRLFYFVTAQGNR